MIYRVDTGLSTYTFLISNSRIVYIVQASDARTHVYTLRSITNNTIAYTEFTYGSFEVLIAFRFPIGILQSFFRSHHRILRKPRHPALIGGTQPIFGIPHPIFSLSLRYNSCNLTRKRRKLRAPVFDGNDAAVAIQ